MPECSFYSEPNEEIVVAPGGGLASGDVVAAAGGRAGFVLGLKSVDAGDKAAVCTDAYAKVAASAPAWVKGDEIWFDASAGVAVKKSATLDGSADLYLGVAAEAKALNATEGYVLLNKRITLDPIVFEFDCEGGDTADHVLIPAEMNPNGLLITHIFGIVSEVFAGGTQDQGVVTVEDSDNNALTTITVADTSGDAAGDYRLGYNLSAAAAGDAAKTVAAGKAVTGRVSQQTTGTSAAGKLKVYVRAIPLV
jgi:hypothetical protein